MFHGLRRGARLLLGATLGLGIALEPVSDFYRLALLHREFDYFPKQAGE